MSNSRTLHESSQALFEEEDRLAFSSDDESPFKQGNISKTRKAEQPEPFRSHSFPSQSFFSTYMQSHQPSVATPPVSKEKKLVKASSEPVANELSVHPDKFRIFKFDDEFKLNSKHESELELMPYISTRNASAPGKKQ